MKGEERLVRRTEEGSGSKGEWWGMREKFGGGKCEVEVEGKKTRSVNRERERMRQKFFILSDILRFILEIAVRIKNKIL